MLHGATSSNQSVGNPTPCFKKAKSVTPPLAPLFTSHSHLLPSLPSLVHPVPPGIFPHSKPQSPPNPLPHLLLILRPPLPPHLRGLHVRGALVVRLRQHAHDADEDFLYRLDGGPAFRGLLVVVRVVARRVQDGDADEAGRVDYARRKNRSLR